MNLTLAEQLRQRRQRRSGLTPPLNLVALMDVFTILVFFFLAHSSSAALSKAEQQIRLPESIAQQPLGPALVVTITPQQLFFEDQSIGTLEAVLASPDSAIPGLLQALADTPQSGSVAGPASGEELAEITADTTAAGDNLKGREITIMADRSIPFRVIKKVMLNCQQAGYQQISLSVVQQSGGVR